jgi:hypothetical protein
MSPEIFLSLRIYGLAIAISMAVALLIRVVVAVVSLRQQKLRSAPRPVPLVAPTDTEGHVAAISAAVYAAIGAHRIVHIRAQGRGVAWTLEGRHDHHVSHKVPHQPRKKP